MGPHNLYTLIAERLVQHSAPITMETYNILFAVRAKIGACWESAVICIMVAV